MIRREEEKKTHASSNMQDNKSVYWYAFTTRKFPSTSHAANIKSDDRLEVKKLRTKVPLTFPAITEYQLAPPFEAICYRWVSL